jgi:predicted short-subunit dehydrogenase-like oxidoreductase (DUF2520 family)
MAKHTIVTHRNSETVSIVGAGRVGRTLGRRLHELGWWIDIVTARSTSNARAAVRVIGAGNPSDRLTHQVLNSKVVLVTVPDAAIECVANQLAQLGGEEWRGKVVLHTSGAMEQCALKPLAELGAATGSLHPMQTFSHQNSPDLATCIFGIDGSPAALRAARKMIHQMGGVAVRLSGTNKAAYHAAGSFACVYVLTIVEAATRLLMTQGFTRRRAMRALLPLTRQTLDNFERVGPYAAWTGPLSRGDFSTLQKHVEALSELDPEYLQAYEVLSRLAVKLLDPKPGPLSEQLERVFADAPTLQHK